MSERDYSESRPPAKTENPFLVVIVVIIALLSFVYLRPADEDLLFYTPLSNKAEADRERAAAILEKLLNIPGVHTALSNRRVNVRVSGNFFLVQNAMIVPSRDGANLEIYFYTGFIDKITDNQLAAILGHELGHAILGHTEQGYIVRPDNMPRFEDVYCDCYAVRLGGRENTAEALRGLFGEKNTKIEVYLTRILKICDEDKIFAPLEPVSPDQKTPKK